MRRAWPASVLAALLLLPGLAAGAWPSTVLGGTHRAIAAVALGDGDGDGAREVYASTGGSEARVLQFTWDGSAWTQRLVGSASEGLRGLAVGDADHDGAGEVYAVGTDGHVFRFAWDGAAWGRTRLTTDSSRAYRSVAIALGDVDADGRDELYVGVGPYLYRLRYDEAWHATNITAFGSAITTLAVGDQDNDTKPEVWVGTDRGWLHRVFKDPAGWNVTEISFGPVQQPFRGLAIGDLNDGDLGDANHTREVYAVQRDELFYFTFERGAYDPQGHWQRYTPCFTDNCFAHAATMNITGLGVDNLTGDAELELYYTSINNRAYQLRHAGYNTWARDDLGQASPLLALDVGDGGAGGLRSYVGTEQGNVVEFTPP
jgi:hypothetical protein